MTKDDIRKALRSRRRDFVADVESRGERQAMEKRVADHVLARIGDARLVSAYLSDRQEIDPLPILHALADRGIATALPHVRDRDAPMRFLRWSPGDPLDTGPFRLRQPSADSPEVEPDLILTPLLGFDRTMRRIGQGAGFYDRAFARLPHARRIGLSWSVQEWPSLPADPWDVPLHGVATELEWIEPER